MELEKLKELGRKMKIDSGDVEAMYRAGVTLSLTENAAKVGLDLGDVRDVYFTFGPPSVPVIVAMLAKAGRTSKV